MAEDYGVPSLFQMPAGMPSVQGPDEETLRQIRMLALARMGFGMASREPLGKAVGAGASLALGGMASARKQAMQAQQLAQAQHKYEKELLADQQQVELRKQQAQDIQFAQALAARMGPQAFTDFLAMKPEERMAVREKMAPVMSSGQMATDYQGRGVSLPTEKGVVTAVGDDGMPRQMLAPGAANAQQQQAFATAAGTQQAENRYKPIPVNVGGGREGLMPYDQFTQGQQNPNGSVTLNLKDAPRADAIKILQQLTQGEGAPGGGVNVPYGVKPSPVEVRGAEEGIVTREQQRRFGYQTMLDNSKTMYEDIRKQYMASRDLTSSIANLEKLDQAGVFSGKVGEWEGKFASFWNSAFPGSKIEGDKLANTETAQTEIGKMQQAIARTFPGSQSDRELIALTTSLPDLMKGPNGRAQIYATLRRKVADQEASYRSASKHMKENDGNLVGWEPPAYTPPPDAYGAGAAPVRPTATMTPTQKAVANELRKKHKLRLLE